MSLAAAVEHDRAAHPDLPVQHWVVYDTPADLEQQLNALEPGVFAKAIISNDVSLKSSEGIVDAIGMLELDERAGVVGGPVMQGDIVSSIGLLGGLNDFVASPFAGWPRHNINGHLWACNHPVTAFPMKAVVIRASLIESGIRARCMDNQNSLAGLLFCLEAIQRGYTVAYSFLMENGNRLQPFRKPGADADTKAAILRDYPRGDRPLRLLHSSEPPR